MSVFRSTEMNGIQLFLILVFPFPAVSGQYDFFYVRGGDEVSLPCTSVRTDHHECDSTAWFFSQNGGRTIEELVAHGKISKKVLTTARAARLSVTSDCSLVIKNLRDEDGGIYTCRQYTGPSQYSDARVDLSLIHLTEHQDTDKLMLYCSVSTWRRCGETLVWLFDGEKLTGSNSIQTSQSPCNTTVTFLTTFNKNLKERFKCEVTDSTGKVQTFGFTSLSSGKTTTTSTTTSTTASTTASTTTTSTTATPKETTAGLITNADPSKPADSSTQLYSLVAVGLAALLIIIVVITCWKRARGKEKPTDDNAGLTLDSDVNPAVNQSGAATNQDKADDNSGLTYASILHTKKIKTAGKAQVQVDIGEDGTVTYATVKPSYASAGDCAMLYATVNKPNR